MGLRIGAASVVAEADEAVAAGCSTTASTENARVLKAD